MSDPLVPLCILSMEANSTVILKLRSMTWMVSVVSVLLSNAREKYLNCRVLICNCIKIYFLIFSIYLVIVLHDKHVSSTSSNFLGIISSTIAERFSFTLAIKFANLKLAYTIFVFVQYLTGGSPRHP